MTGIEKAFEAREVLKKKASDLSLSCFAYVGEGPPWYKHEQPCFGFMPGYQVGGAPWFVFYHHKRDVPYKQAIKDRPSYVREERRYADYLINRSYFADCFEDKNVSRHINLGAIMNTKFATMWHICAAVFDRHRTEYPQIVTTWNRLVASGMDEHAALFFAYCVRWDTKRKMFRRNVWQGGHAVFKPSCMDAKGIKRWITCDPSMPKNPPMMSISGSYYGYTAMWFAKCDQAYKAGGLLGLKYPTEVQKTIKLSFGKKTETFIPAKDIVKSWEWLLEEWKVMEA